MVISKKVWVLTVSALLLSPFVFSQSNSDIDSLRKQIEGLQSRLASLELRQSFATFMPDMAERFHVMHRAGRAGDWAVASHELTEIQRLVELSTDIDSEKGKLMLIMMQTSLDKLDSAIDQGNTTAFERSLEQSVESCNACHNATDSAFIQVTLDERDSLSIRHPHTFTARAAPQEHGHGEATEDMHKAQPSMDSDQKHEEVNDAPHKD